MSQEYNPGLIEEVHGKSPMWLLENFDSARIEIPNSIFHNNIYSGFSYCLDRTSNYTARCF